MLHALFVGQSFRGQRGLYMAIRSGTAHQALELWQLNQPGQKRFADRAPEASLVTGILWTGATPTDPIIAWLFVDAPSMGSGFAWHQHGPRGVRNNLIKDCFLKKSDFQLATLMVSLAMAAVTWWVLWAPWAQGMAWTSHLVRRWTCMLPCPPHGRRPRSPKDYCHPNLGWFHHRFQST